MKLLLDSVRLCCVSSSYISFYSSVFVSLFCLVLMSFLIYVSCSSSSDTSPIFGSPMCLSSCCSVCSLILLASCFSVSLYVDICYPLSYSSSSSSWKFSLVIFLLCLTNSIGENIGVHVSVFLILFDCFGIPSATSKSVLITYVFRLLRSSCSIEITHVHFSCIFGLPLPIEL